MEKPKTIEVGQRWAPRDSGWSGPSFVIEGSNDDLNYGHPVRWDVSGGAGYWKPDDIVKSCTFLGYAPGYGPQPSEAPGPAMRPATHVENVALLFKDGRITMEEAARRLAPAQPSEAPREATVMIEALTGLPLAPGSKFYPGQIVTVSAAPQPVPADCVAPALVAPDLVEEAKKRWREKNGGLREAIAALVKLPPGRDTYEDPTQGAPASCYMEQWDGATHMPVTALQRIQERKKPEPWRPSIDDFDLLPDV